jgi:RNA polymerase sigma-70 factor (ECF subfamily)
MTGPGQSREREFRDLFARTAVRVRGYVRRHCDEDDCDDILSEVYLVAWRRFHELPEDPLPWLLGTARRVLANHWRGRDRQARFVAEVAGLARFAVEPDPAGQAISRAAMVGALAELDADDRELLLLVGWDGLDGAGVAEVLGCSPGAARMRLTRARQRLEQLLAGDPEEPSLSRRRVGKGS